MAKAAIGKWGNSAALRIPAGVMKDARFSANQQVNISVSKGRIVIEPVQVVDFDLEELIAGITPENSHSEVSFGKPVGKETL
jgi:antitoxin MazE